MQNNVWRIMNTGLEIQDIGAHLKDWIETHPNYKMYVGCDSTNNKDETVFATAIVLHDDGKGGHVIYSKTNLKRIRLKLERLWKEVEFSVDTTKMLLAMGIDAPDFIDVDLNPDARYPSNQLLSSAVGMVESMGIQTRWKSKSPWSISAADVLCRE